MSYFQQRLSAAAARCLPAGSGEKLAAQTLAIMRRDHSPMRTIRALGSKSGVSWIWLVDGEGFDDDGPQSLVDNVAFRLVAYLYGMKLGDTVPAPGDEKQSLRLNTIERLALARVIQRNLDVSVLPGFEDTVETLPLLADHVALLLNSNHYDEFWCGKLAGEEL